MFSCIDSSWILTICSVLDLFPFFNLSFLFSYIDFISSIFFSEWHPETLNFSSSNTSATARKRGFTSHSTVFYGSYVQSLWSRWRENLIDQFWVNQASELKAKNWDSPTQNTWCFVQGYKYGKEIKVGFLRQHKILNVCGLSLYLHSSKFHKLVTKDRNLAISQPLNLDPSSVRV